MSDWVTQLVIQVGSLGLLSVVLLILAPRVLDRMLKVHARDVDRIEEELRKIRVSVHELVNKITTLLAAWELRESQEKRPARR